MPIILVLAKQKNPDTGRFELQPLQISPQRLRRLQHHLRVNRPKRSRQAVESPLVRTKEARVLVGGRGMLDKLERAGWIEPVQRSHRCTLYQRRDLLACIARLEWGEVPQKQEKPLRSKSKRLR
jgi:hypothetical protein